MRRLLGLIAALGLSVAPAAVIVDAVAPAVASAHLTDLQYQAEQKGLDWTLSHGCINRNSPLRQRCAGVYGFKSTVYTEHTWKVDDYFDLITYTGGTFIQHCDGVSFWTHGVFRSDLSYFACN